MEQIKQLLACSKHPNTEGNIGNAVNLLIDTRNKRENVRQ